MRKEVEEKVRSEEQMREEVERLKKEVEAKDKDKELEGEKKGEEAKLNEMREMWELEKGKRK
jgi:hypothetical protein